MHTKEKNPLKLGTQKSKETLQKVKKPKITTKSLPKQSHSQSVKQKNNGLKQKYSPIVTTANSVSNTKSPFKL